MTKPPPPPRDPWQPIPPDQIIPEDVYALKAMQDGVASDGQQKRVLDLIINRLAATYDLPFRPGAQDGERATCFAAGKQFVGQQIIRLLNYDVNALPKRGG